MCTDKINYHDILTPQRLGYDQYSFSELASSMNYPYYSWNGRLFSTEKHTMLGITTELSNASTLHLQNILYPHWRVNNGIYGMADTAKNHGFELFSWNGRFYNPNDLSKDVDLEGLLSTCAKKGTSSCTNSCVALPESSIPIMPVR